MKKIGSRLVGCGFVMAGIVGTLATAAPDAAAGNACKVQGFDITNDTSGTIKVTKVEYRVVGTNTWYTEDLGNKNIGAGKHETWGSQTLSKASNGDMLEFKVVHEDGFNRQSKTGILSTGKQCDKNHTYFLTVK